MMLHQPLQLLLFDVKGIILDALHLKCPGLMKRVHLLKQQQQQQNKTKPKQKNQNMST